jgi:hypothetical protein
MAEHPLFSIPDIEATRVTPLSQRTNLIFRWGTRCFSGPPIISNKVGGRLIQFQWCRQILPRSISLPVGKWLIASGLLPCWFHCLFLHKNESACRIECRRALNHNHLSNIIMQSIYKSHDIVEGIGFRLIWDQMIYQLRELLNVLRDGTRLLNMK